MKMIERAVKKLFFLSMLFSVMFVAGIPMIVLGASKGIMPVMIIGIIFTALGFYGTPMFWVILWRKGRAQTARVCRHGGTSSHGTGNCFPALKIRKGGKEFARYLLPKGISVRIRSQGRRACAQ